MDKHEIILVQSLLPDNVMKTGNKIRSVAIWIVVILGTLTLLKILPENIWVLVVYLVSMLVCTVKLIYEHINLAKKLAEQKIFEFTKRPLENIDSNQIREYTNETIKIIIVRSVYLITALIIAMDRSNIELQVNITVAGILVLVTIVINLILKIRIYDIFMKCAIYQNEISKK